MSLIRAARESLDPGRARVALLLVLALFWISVLRHVEMPGLYMDAINPDYLAARWLHPEIANPAWVMPGPALPLLGNLYHGTQNLYLGLLTYSVFGTSVLSARLTHALFGAAIVALLYMVVRRSTDRPTLALVAAAGLATDMAFIGSFRTQSYIVLGGQVWMLAGLYLALGVSTRQRANTRVLLASGACMGLAVYGYFVHLFFMPVVAALAIQGAGPAGMPRRALLWFGGFGVGLLPYVIGYAWAIVALGGWSPFLEWLQGALSGIKPMHGSPTYLAGLEIGLRDARLALGGIGNEMMMTGKAVSPLTAMLRTILLALGCAVCLAAAALRWRAHPEHARVLFAIAALPIMYWLFAAVFGGRLWVHHYTVLVALSYLVLAAALGVLLTSSMRARMRKSAVAGVLALLIVCNIAQQNRVFDELDRTGGVKTSTEMLGMLAVSALAERKDAVYYFPDWGFFMPFAFLTGNRVVYEIELSTGAIAKHRGTHDEVRVAFWEKRERQRHEAVLREAGVQDIRLYTFAQRNGTPAFYLLAGRMQVTN